MKKYFLKNQFLSEQAQPYYPSTMAISSGLLIFHQHDKANAIRIKIMLFCICSRSLEGTIGDKTHSHAFFHIEELLS